MALMSLCQGHKPLKPIGMAQGLSDLVDRIRIELTTSALRTQRSPN
jgi:hypothetical protein